jgi:hypothetical protein
MPPRTRTPHGTVTAHPNPVEVSDFSRYGITTISWTSRGTSVVEVRVDSPDGPVLTSGSSDGSARTGKWVRDGMVFYLQDATDGRGTEAESTLDSVTVRVTPVRFTSSLDSPSHLRGFLHLSRPGSPWTTLVTGAFSFLGGAPTAGDLLAKDLACEWLRRAGHSYDVALTDPFVGGVDWQTVEPERYTHVLYVCGPFFRNDTVVGLLARFSHCLFSGLNVSMMESLDSWNPFHVLLERDSSANARPDLTFLSTEPLAPLVAVVPVEPEPEHGYRGMHDHANASIRRLLASRPLAIVEIDTRLDKNVTGLRNPAEVEALISRMDVVITTRLHGMVLALKNGVPALAIDPHEGGAKVKRQAETTGWPIVFTGDTVTDDALRQALAYCLTADARRQARACAQFCIRSLATVRDDFITAMSTLPSPNSRHAR